MGLLRTFAICVCLLTMTGSVKGSEVKRQKLENNALPDDRSVQPGIWTPERPRRLFARTRFELQQRLQRPRSRTVTSVIAQASDAKAGIAAAPPAPPVVPVVHGAGAGAGPAPVVVRRCPGLMETCFPHTPCCDPCATCHCRLFNTICHCWRMSHLCPRKT